LYLEKAWYVLSFPQCFSFFLFFLKNSVSAEVASTLSFIGIGSGAGADEDDFHTFKRKNLEVNKEERDNERRKKQQLIKVAAHSGVVKAFGRTTQTPRKVVHF
jgi:zinc finger CCHC domain-containing protein 9